MPKEGPDFEFWLQMSEVSLLEAVALICGMNPEEADWFFLLKKPAADGSSSHSPHPPELCRAFRRAYRMAVGNFPPSGDLPVVHSYVKGAQSVGDTPVLFREFIDWSLRKRLSVDPALASSAAASAPSHWEGFDPDSLTYPKLLDIAFQAWRFATTTAPTTAHPKRMVLEFLRERYPDLPEASREKIAAICNWKPFGGRPSGEVE